MKNFLLVIPQFVHKGEYYSFPLGLGYVSSYLKKKGINVFCLNLCHFDECVSTEEIIRKNIEENKIDVFCTGTLSWYWDKVDEILKIAKKIKPEIINIVGGAIVISDPELALKNLDIDIAVLGEGEETMAELADTLNKNGKIENVQGIAYLKNGEFKITQSRAYIENLDSLPFPDYEGFEFDKWTNLIQGSGNLNLLDDYDNLKYAEIVGSRSCPFSCTFCYHHLGQKYRQRSLNNIFQEIDFLVKNYKINYFYFLDELFSANHQRMLEFAERIKKYDIIGWGGSFRVNNVKKEILIKLKESGIKYIGYGVENINDEILSSMRKMTTRDEIEKALYLTREVGIHCSGNIIFGDPAETEETIKKSMDWFYKNPQFNISLVFLKVIPDSPVYQYAIKNNFIKDKFAHIKNQFPLINLTNISDSKIFKLQGQILWAKQAQPQLLPGKLIKTEKIEEKRYLIEVECPFCHHISESKNWLNDWKYKYIMCRKCGSQNKILSSKIFKKDFNIIKSTLKYWERYLLFYLMRFKFYRKKQSEITNYTLKIKKVIKLLIFKS